MKSLPTLIKKQKSIRKLAKLCELTRLAYEEPPARPWNWLFLKHCHLIMSRSELLSSHIPMSAPKVVHVLGDHLPVLCTSPLFRTIITVPCPLPQLQRFLNLFRAITTQSSQVTFRLRITISVSSEVSNNRHSMPLRYS